MEVGNQELTTAVEPLSYTGPLIVAISPNTGGTKGKDTLTITGSDFGVSGQEVKIGTWICPTTISASHGTLVVKTPPGVGAELPVTVSVGGQTSNSKPFTYRSPTITDISPTSGPTSSLDAWTGKPIVISIKGTDFGTKNVTDQTEILFDGFIAVNASKIFSHTNEELKFHLPPGQGENIRITVRIGGQLSNNDRYFSYDRPAITSVKSGYCVVGTPPNDVRTGFCSTSADCPKSAEGIRGTCIRLQPTHGCRPDGFEPLEAYKISRSVGGAASRACTSKHYVQLIGRNFGVSGIKIHVGGQDTSNIIGPCPNCEHTHTSVVVEAPQGMGVNISIAASLPGSCGGKPAGSSCLRRFSNDLLYSFDPPHVVEAVPGTPTPYNAEGDEITIHGDNFGNRNSSVIILIKAGSSEGGAWKTCSEAQWHPADKDGFPYLSCRTPRDVVGPKALKVAVAEQMTEVTVVPGSGGLSTVNSVCMQSGPDSSGAYKTYYAVEGTYCVPCPVGSSCSSGTFNYPIAQENFWMTWLNLSQPCTKEEHDANTAANILTHESKLCSDYIRGTVEGRCPEERWNIQKYGDNVLAGLCPDTVACQPAEACTGNNTCAKEYQWVLAACKAQLSANPVNCTTDLDCDPDPLRDCSANSPEHCSKCSPEGKCVCTHPTRCALCTQGEYYRNNNRCEECPKNPTLTILAFVVAAICACIGGYVMHEYKFNLAFISIGVDYFQVLAIFSATDIRWPTELYYFFKQLMVFNINVDIAAPECLVPNFEYELKWYGTMGLPLASAVIFVLVYLVLLCCKRRGDPSAFDPLLGNFITMFYYMYLSLTRRALDVFNW